MNHRANWIWVLSAACLIACLVPVARAVSDDEYVNLQRWASPSGKWVLTIDPSKPDGAGAAMYTMFRDEKKAWAGRLDYTLRRAVVSDKGVVAGFAYDNGHTGWGGNMLGIVIDPAGKITQADAHKRDGPAFNIDPPPPGEPMGAGVILDHEADRAIIRAHQGWGKEPAAWWIYRLSDGQKLSEYVPKPPQDGDLGFSRELEAELVPGTGLILVHWYLFRGDSAQFELIDRAGAVVWSLPIEQEYQGLGEHWRWWDLVEKKVRQIETSPSAFAIISYKLGDRVTYSLARGEDAQWTVKETARQKAVPAAGMTELKWDPKPIELKKLGEVKLQTPESQSVIEGVCNLSIDDKGRMGWVRWVRGAEGAEVPARFTLVGPDGKTVSDRPLEMPKVKSGTLPRALWLGGDRWLVGRTSYGEGNDLRSSADAWFLDAAKGELTRIEDFKAGSIESMARAPDGGFVVLSKHHGDYTIRDQVARYDRDGKLIKSRTEKGYGQGDSYHDVAVLTDGSLAALNAVPFVIKTWRPGKDEPEVLNLESLLGGQIYAAHMRADVDGGVIVLETHDGCKLCRIDKNGKLWQTLLVQGPNGEKFRLYDSFEVDPEGRVWTSDHNRLFRCDATGKPDLTLGGAGENTMDEPVAVTVDAKGRIYALEKATAAVHVFDPEGKSIRVMRPKPEDLWTQDALAWIVVDKDGSVRARMSWEGPVTRFGPEGEPLASDKPSRQFDFGEAESWRPVPGAAQWKQSFHAIQRLNPDGSVAQEIGRRAGGEWFRSLYDVEAGADGSIAVLCAEHEGLFRSRGSEPAWLCVYGPKGETIVEMKVPQPSIMEHMSFDGRRAWMVDMKGVTIIPIATRQPVRWTMPGDEGGVTVLIIDPGNGDWLTWRSGSRSIERWEPPK